MTEAVLVVGGRVFTGRRYAEALLVEGPRVVVAGTEAQVRREAPTGADRIDLSSSLVVPGLADAHLHLGELTREREALDLGPVASISALQEHLRRRAEERPRGPLVGRGLDLETLAERRWPTVAELDAAVADRPVVLQHASGHAAVANSPALERAYGPVRGGRPDGPRNGVVVEEELDALRPVVREGLPLTPEAVERTMRELAALGLTAVGTMNTGEEELSILRQLDRDGRLPFRVRAYPPIGRVPEGALLGERDGGRLRVVGVKAFLDGAFGPRTASICGPYADDASTEGIDRGDDASLRGALDEACRRGLGPALHAIGDRAVERAIRLLSGRPAARSPPGSSMLASPPHASSSRSVRPACTSSCSPGSWRATSGSRTGSGRSASGGRTRSGP
jgi:hypothetical protein